MCDFYVNRFGKLTLLPDLVVFTSGFLKIDLGCTDVCD